MTNTARIPSSHAQRFSGGGASSSLPRRRALNPVRAGNPGSLLELPGWLRLAGAFSAAV